jgi:ribonuclease HII
VTLPNFIHEEKLLAKGCAYIAGVDEAGRGPLAGPVVAAAVIFAPHKKIKGLKDSKLLTPKFREEIYHEILANSKCVGIGIVSERIIDKINILQATLLAMHRAISRLAVVPHHVLIDGINKVNSLVTPQTTIIEGDNISASIAAASVVAKVTRDRIMKNLSVLFPDYGLEQHMGYGTEKHLKALKGRGPLPIHRKTFAPVREES